MKNYIFPWTLHAVEQILVFQSTPDEYLKMPKKTEHRLKFSIKCQISLKRLGLGIGYAT